MAKNTLFSVNPSQNKKLGKKGKMWSTYRPVTKTVIDGESKDGTCPSACPFLTKCYANFSFTNIHQGRAIGKNDNLVEKIAALPPKAKVRHLVSGDFGMGDELDDYLPEAIEAHKNRPDVTGYSYTHHWREHKAEEFNQATNFMVNASCESTEDVRLALKNGWMAVQVVPEDTPDKVDNGDFRAIVCLEQSKGISCEDCMLCARKRDVVIMFRSHGNNKKQITSLATSSDAS